jgi:hypothetical protein
VVVATTIWIAIIATVIRPVVWAVSPTVIPPIRIAIVATISVATISITRISVTTTISPIATPLGYIAVYATLRVRRGSKRRRYGKREDAH